MTRVLVCGGRDYRDRARVFEVLDKLHAERGFDFVLHCATTHVELDAEIWAATHCITVIRLPYELQRQACATSRMTIRWMTRKCRPDLVVAFPGGAVAEDCVAYARAAGIEVIEIGG